MVNRVLIRIKVVQLLYSYLLTRSDFKIEPAPGPEATRDRQIAYSLYLDLLLLLLELSGQKVGDSDPAGRRRAADDKVLKASPMAKALGSDAKIRELILKGKNSVSVFDDALGAIYDAIVESPAYGRLAKLKERNLAADVEFWCDMLLNVIARVPAFDTAARSRNEYSGSAMQTAIGMVCRTLNSYNDSRTQLIEAKDNLDKSLALAHDLYNRLLSLSIAITDMQAMRLDAAKHKYLPTQQDLTPDTRFIDNEFVRALGANTEMSTYIDNNPDVWGIDDELTVRRLLDSILESDIYKNYMAAPATDYRTDCEFWRAVYKQIILPSDILADALESKSVFWNDDLDTMGTFVIKTVKQFAASPDGGKNVRLQPMFKDEEDATFGSRLFVDAIDNRERYRSYIDRFINQSQWDSERLAFMDIVIMITAIAELLTFPAIPVPVTLNEYIEIANCYSTPRSGHFVNGVLFSVINYLKSEGLLNKSFEK